MFGAPGAWNVARTAKVADYARHCNGRAFAGKLDLAGVALRTMADLLGHRKLRTVSRYLDLAIDIRLRPWTRPAIFQGRNGRRGVKREVARLR
jgi:hypothetical protein